MTSNRKPRKRGASRASKEASQRANRAETSRGLLKKRIIALESRMAVLERLCWEHLSPDVLVAMDQWLDATHPAKHSEEE